MVRRLASASLVAALLALVGLTADAQFGNPLKKIKPPSLPGRSAPATPAQPAAPATPQPGPEPITEEEIAKFLKAMQVQREVLAKELAQANALKAKADAAKAKLDAAQQRCAQQMVDTMMKTEECKDRFKAKDPRSKEAARLEDQVAAASERGDEAKSDALRQKLDPLNTALDLDADRACGGKGSSALHDCMAAKKETLARKGIAEPMLSIQAQNECMQEGTSGMPGTAGGACDEKTGALRAAKDEEAAASQAAAQAFSLSRENADAAGYKAAELSKVRFARVDHCVRGRIDGGPGCDEDSNIVIDRYRGELRKAKAGKS